MLAPGSAVALTSQTIAFPPPTGATAGGSATLGAAADSGLPVTYASATPAICSVSGATALFHAAGTCTINADQAGDGATWDPAPTASASFTVALAPQTISFSAMASGAANGSAALVASATSGLAVTFSSLTPSVCSVSGATANFLAAGTCAVAANQPGDGSVWAPAAQATQSATVSLAPQTIAFSPLTSTIAGGSAPLTASASSGLPVAFASQTPAVCSVSGSTVNYLTSGTCVVAANQSGDGSVWAAAAQATQSASVSLATQTISFTAPTGAIAGGSGALSATATSGLAVSFATQTPAVCTVAGSTVTYLAGGTCTIAADQAGNGIYAAATQALRSFSVAKQTQTISFTAPSGSVGGTSALSATASSGLAVTFGTQTPSTCTVAGTTATYIGAGLCTIAANQSGNSVYSAAVTATQSFTVAKGAQSITFTPAASGFATQTATMAGTASSGLAVAYAASPAGVCTVSGSVLTYVGVGTCTVTASQAGNANWLAATDVIRTVTVSQQAQTITATATPASLAWNATSTLSASGFSGTGAITYGLVSGPCSIAGNVLSATAPGTCVVNATIATDAGYSSATSSNINVTLTKAAQTITFAPATTGFTNQSQTLTATSTSGLTVSLAVTTPTICSLTGATLNYLSVGTCSINATQAGDTLYNAATLVTKTVTVSKQAQTITFAPTLTGTVLGTQTLTATSSSGLAVSLATTTPAICSLSGSTTGSVVTYAASGSCIINATQAGDSSFNAATTVSKTIVISKQAQTITFNPTLTGTVLNTQTMTATSSSGLPVTLTVTTPTICSLSGSTTGSVLTYNLSGTCTVSATQTGDAIFAAATTVNKNIVVSKIAQTITTVSTPSTIPWNSTSTLSTTGSTGTGAITYAYVSGLCSVTSNVVTPTASGNCVVKSTIAADTYYNTATSANLTIVVSKTNQTITFTMPTNDFAGTVYSMTATSTSGLAVTYTSSTLPICTVSGSNLTYITAGTCTVNAVQAGDTRYNAATTVSKSIAVARQSQTITAVPAVTTTPWNQTVALSAVKSGTGAVTYTMVSGPCTIAGAVLTPTGQGTCTFKATIAQDAAYLAATSANVSVTTTIGVQTINATSTPSSLQVNQSATLGSSGQSGTGARTYSLVSGPCTLVGATLTGTGAGACVVDVTIAADANYAGATSADLTVNVSKVPQTIAVSAPASLTFGQSGSLSASGQSGTGAISYSVVSGPCSVSGATLITTGGGTCSVTASIAADNVYAAATSSAATVIVNKAPQLLSIAATPAGLATSQSATLSASGQSGTGSVSYTVVSGPCSASGATLTANGAGTCSITGTILTDADYLAATSPPLTVVVVKGVQTISAVAAPSSLVTGQSATLSIAGQSGSGAVSYARVSGPCSVSGATLAATGAGSCAFTATIGSDADWESATASAVVAIAPAPQSIVVAATPASLVTNQSAALSASGQSGTGAISYAVVSGPCSISGATLTASAAGSCSVTATIAADANYLAATSSALVVAVGPAPQSLSVAANPPSLVTGQSATLSASGQSGTGAVTFVVTSGPCAILTGSVTASAAGSCTVTATIAADANYQTATSPPLTIPIGKGTQSLTVSSSPSSLVTGQSATLSVSGQSGAGLVAFSVVSGPCSISGATLTATGAGTCSVTATIAADADWLGATSAALSIAVGKANQSVSISGPSTLTTGASAPLSVSGQSGGGATTYAVVSGPCTVSGSTLIATGSGVCQVTATVAADANYLAATSTPLSVSVSVGAQSLSVAAAPSSLVTGQSATLSASGQSGTGAISFVLSGGPCTLFGATLTATGAGSCVVTASVAADANYQSATSPPLTVSVSPAPQSLTVFSSPAALVVHQSATLSASGQSGTGALTYAVASGPCAIIGATVTAHAAGSCSIVAQIAADANYLAATSPAISIAVGPTTQSIAVAVTPALLATGQSGTLSASGFSGTGAVSYAVVSGPCVIANGVLTATGAGTCQVTAAVAADANYLAATSPPFTVTSGLGPQSIVVAATPSSLATGQSATLSASGQNGAGTVSYAVVSGPCNVVGAVVTAQATGSCVVRAIVAADAITRPPCRRR